MNLETPLFVHLPPYQVYTLTLKAGGVPSAVVDDYKPQLSNMLGLVRGNIYYNLMNWYRCLSCLPVGGDKSKFMETMMGVKQVLASFITVMLGTLHSHALSAIDARPSVHVRYFTQSCSICNRH